MIMLLRILLFALSLHFVFSGLNQEKVDGNSGMDSTTRNTGTFDFSNRIKVSILSGFKNIGVKEQNGVKNQNIDPKFIGQWYVYKLVRENKPDKFFTQEDNVQDLELTADGQVVTKGLDKSYWSASENRDTLFVFLEDQNDEGLDIVWKIKKITKKKMIILGELGRMKVFYRKRNISFAP